MPVIGRVVWEILAGAVITFATSVAALGTWPNKFQWLILISGSVGAGFKAANAYRAQPR